MEKRENVFRATQHSLKPLQPPHHSDNFLRQVLLQKSQASSHLLGANCNTGSFRNHIVTESCLRWRWKVIRGKETNQVLRADLCPSTIFIILLSRLFPHSPEGEQKLSFQLFLNNQICFAATGLNPRDRRSKHVRLPVRFFLSLKSLSSEAEGRAFSVFLLGKHFSSKESQRPPRQGGILYPFQEPLGRTRGTKRESGL